MKWGFSIFILFAVANKISIHWALAKSIFYSINYKRERYYPDLLKTIVFNKAPLNINYFISDWKTYSINNNYAIL